MNMDMDNRIGSDNVQILGENIQVHLGPQVVVNGDLQNINFNRTSVKIRHVTTKNIYLDFDYRIS